MQFHSNTRFFRYSDKVIDRYVAFNAISQACLAPLQSAVGSASPASAQQRLEDLVLQDREPAIPWSPPHHLRVVPTAVLGVVQGSSECRSIKKPMKPQKETSFQFHDRKIICLLHFILIYENLLNMRILFGIFIWIITATSIFPIHIVSMIFAGLKLRLLINQKIIKFCHLKEWKT